MSVPSGINPYGAVDLGALAQQRQAREKAEAARAERVAGGGAAAAVTAVDATDQNFQDEIIARSMTVPVVIDFWADWCGPCKQLSPVLERLAEQDAGAWVLAKVDVDANPGLAQAAQVQSIPTVMVAWQGQVVPGFAGAIPEAQVRDFLDQVLALGTGAGSAGDGEVPTPEAPELDAAADAIDRGDLDAAEEAYRRALAERPGDADASAGLALVGVMRRTGATDASAAYAAADAAPRDVDAALLAADHELLAGRPDAAFDRLVRAVAASSGPDRERARARLLELFEVVGPDDPAVAAARGRLASALF